MPTRNRQLTVSNVDGFLSQINETSGPDTIIKIKCKGANCLFRTGSKKNIKKAIELYTEAYDIQYEIRDFYHPRTLNILNISVQTTCSVCGFIIDIINKKNPCRLGKGSF